METHLRVHQDSVGNLTSWWYYCPNCSTIHQTHIASTIRTLCPRGFEATQ